MDKTIIWGHRGAGFRGVENSLSSFKKCVEMGVDGIKTEAHLTKDDSVILRFLPFIIIDGKKTRTNELNHEEIKQIKLENGESIPTLNEMFEEFKDKIRYNFDIRNVETGEKIIDLALKYDLLDNIEIDIKAKVSSTNNTYAGLMIWNWTSNSLVNVSTSWFNAT